jgi:Trypsin
MEETLNRLWLIPAAVAMAIASGASFAQSSDDNQGLRKPAGRERAAGWTPAAMERAQLVPRPNVDPAAVRAAARTGQRAARPDIPGETPSKDIASGVGDRSAGNVTEKPLYWAGKLFFRVGQDGYVCSAQFISPTVLLTAAHCVRDPDTGNWNEDFIFALQYKNGKYSERYDYECAATKQGWLSEGFDKYLYDYALILVDHPSKTGYFGTYWGWQGEYNDATKIGYPGGISDGEVIQVDHGPIQFVEGVVQMKHGDTADQHGSSGGAWIGDYSQAKSEDNNYIISVESFGLEDEPGVDYGPYLNADFKSLWDYVENGCQ